MKLLCCLLFHRKIPDNEYTIAHKYKLVPFKVGNIRYKCKKCNLSFGKGISSIKRKGHKWTVIINEYGDIKKFGIYLKFKYFILPEKLYFKLPKEK